MSVRLPFISLRVIADTNQKHRIHADYAYSQPINPKINAQSVRMRSWTAYLRRAMGAGRKVRSRTMDTSRGSNSSSDDVSHHVKSRQGQVITCSRLDLLLARKRC